MDQAGHSSGVEEGDTREGCAGLLLGQQPPPGAASAVQPLSEAPQPGAGFWGIKSLFLEMVVLLG